MSILKNSVKAFETRRNIEKLFLNKEVDTSQK